MNLRLLPQKAQGGRSLEKERALASLVVQLRETFRLKNEGAAYSELSYSQGIVDGYMRSLLDLGLVSQKELLSVVAEVRRGVDGPATRPVELDTLVASA
jgi:hypothetical protein